MAESNIEKAWAAYEAAERDRIRDVSLARLRDLIGLLKSLPEAQWFEWARSLSRQSVDEGLTIPVRMPLFREVLFPSLHAGLQDREQGCARWLAGFSQLLCQSDQCRSQLSRDHQSETGLLREALAVDPDDARARSMLIKALRWRLEYSLHELPAGVLYEQDAATIEQCRDLQNELDEFENLAAVHGVFAEHKDLIAACRYHYETYPAYLAKSSEFRSYEHYLAQTSEG